MSLLDRIFWLARLSSSFSSLPRIEMELWFLRKPMTLVSTGKWRSEDVTGNSNDAFLYNSATDLTGDVKLTEVTKLQISSTAPVIAIDNLMDYPFFTDGVSLAKDKYVGDFPADYVYNRDDLLFAKIDSGGISNVILFKTKRTELTFPKKSTVLSFLKGEIVYTGTYKTDENGEPILNDQGGLQFY